MDVTDKLKDYDVIFLAALVGMNIDDKNKVIQHLAKYMAPGAILMLRSAHGARAFLYPVVDPNVLDGFNVLSIFHPDDDVINSVVISRKFVEPVNIDNNYHDLDIGFLMASSCKYCDIQPFNHPLDLSSCGKDDLLEYVKVNMGQYSDIESLFYRVPGKPENFALDCRAMKWISWILLWVSYNTIALLLLMIVGTSHFTTRTLYSVSVMRKYIDSRSLLTEGNKTRWNKLVPIKISILAWRLINDRLPTRSKLYSRGIDLHSLLCPVCDENIESAQHLLVHCNLACDLWSLVFKWWKPDNVPNTLMDLMTWVDSTNL
ncbi:nicotianamine synthase, S-adenosyl-L-methionine-dependent methyltransferase [Tanacetum coccineum]|uniref:Nicotianamine synthase n=1 Tax=Tanacetum coccineum TaxID=301880 RepID=A0ABQ4X334_9ASTR